MEEVGRCVTPEKLLVTAVYRGSRIPKLSAGDWGPSEGTESLNPGQGAPLTSGTLLLLVL